MNFTCLGNQERLKTKIKFKKNEIVYMLMYLPYMMMGFPFEV